MLADKRSRRERALDLSLRAMAFRADARDINRKVGRDMQDD